MNISLRQLEYVIAAARQGSVTGAAAALNISPSSVLMAIDKFEDEFKIQVFVRRRSQGLTATAAGERAITRIIQFLDQANAFETEMGPQGSPISGAIQVGCYSSLSPSIVPQIIRNIRRDYPGLTVHLHEGDIMRIQNFLRSGAVDMLLTYDEGLSEDFDFEPMADAPPHAVLATDDPLARQDVVSLRQLAERTFLLLDLPHSRNYALSLFQRYNLQPTAVQRMETFEMTRSSVAAGLGVSILNIRPMIDATYGGHLVVCKPIVEELRPPRVVLATRRGGRTSRRTGIFGRYCRNFFQSDAARKIFVAP